MSESEEKIVHLRGYKCPICGQPGVEKYRPFCSKRCADIDLGRWFKEDYRVPSEDEPDLDDGAYSEE